MNKAKPQQSVASIIKKYERPTWMHRVTDDSDHSDSESIGSQDSLRSIEEDEPTESDEEFIDDEEVDEGQRRIVKCK